MRSFFLSIIAALPLGSSVLGTPLTDPLGNPNTPDYTITSPSTPVTSTPLEICKNLEIVFARGSGEEVKTGDSFTSFKSAIKKSLSKYLPITYNIYDLGTSSYAGAQYPAVEVSQPVSTFLSAGRAYDFGASVASGQAELKGYISAVGSRCSNTKFALVGYSQGAMVISKTLPEIDPSKILYVATIGDPKLYLPEGEGLFPKACQSEENFSEYRVDVPDCRANSGILGALKPYQPVGYSQKLGTWCNDHDFMCSSRFNFSNLMEAHTSYIRYDRYTEVAKIIAEKAGATLKNASLSSKSNVIILLQDGDYESADKDLLISKLPTYKNSCFVFAPFGLLNLSAETFEPLTTHSFFNDKATITIPHKRTIVDTQKYIAANSSRILCGEGEIDRIFEADFNSLGLYIRDFSPKALDRLFSENNPNYNSTPRTTKNTLSQIQTLQNSSSDSAISNPTYKNGVLTFTVDPATSTTGAVIILNDAILGILDQKTLIDANYRITITDLRNDIENNLSIQLINSTGEVTTITTHHLPATNTQDNTKTQNKTDADAPINTPPKITNLPEVPDCSTASPDHTTH